MKNPRPLILCLLMLVSVQCTFGQTENATITGRVTDPSKAVVVGAEVVLIVGRVTGRAKNEAGFCGGAKK